MPLISHRGAAGLAPENSLESFRIATKFKPVFIETDVHCSGDGIFIIYHGDLKQTLTGERRSETYEQLKKTVPTLLTLEELLKRRFKTPFMFDIKCADDVESLITFLKSQRVPSTVGFTSPHSSALYRLKQAFPWAMTMISQPYHHGPIAAIELARDNNFSGISLNKWWLGPIVSIMCRHYKKEIMVYTINHSLWLWFAQTFFKNAYICTDYPNRYRKHFPVIPLQ